MVSKTVDRLITRRYETRAGMGIAAATDVRQTVLTLLKAKESVSIVFAAAPSQDEFLLTLAQDEQIPFERVHAFHMDEYIGLAPDAPQGFGNFLNRNLFSKRKFLSVSYLNGQAKDSAAECCRYAALLNENEIDIVCMGIGENGHIAFNDPPVADFHDPMDVKVVQLDEVCRMQQVHDGCFDALEQVPLTALTLTVPRLMRAKYHFCIVPGSTKTDAVHDMLHGEVSERCPASILRCAENAVLYLDPDSAERW